MNLEEFLADLHPTSVVLSAGTAKVLDREVPAVLVLNRIYNQRLVWGMFSVDRGKFKGRLACSAGTEDVVYSAGPGVPGAGSPTGA